jgi:hypothetical protein
MYLCVQQFINACVKHPLVGKPKFPSNVIEAESYAQEWAKLSGPIGSDRHGILTKCIGVIDGILINTRAPHQNARQSEGLT